MTFWKVMFLNFVIYYWRSYLFKHFLKIYFCETVQRSTKGQKDGPDNLSIFFSVPEFYCLIKLRNLKGGLIFGNFNFNIQIMFLMLSHSIQ